MRTAGFAPLNRKQKRKGAPHFVLLDASDKRVSLASFRGKALLLDLWTANCGGCVKEMPHMPQKGLQ
jgi:peroxiredoxin